MTDKQPDGFSLELEAQRAGGIVGRDAPDELEPVRPVDGVGGEARHGDDVVIEEPGDPIGDDV